MIHILHTHTRLAAGRLLTEKSGVQDGMSGTPIAYVDSADVPLCRHSTRLGAWSSSSPLIFLHRTLAVPRTRTTLGDRSFAVAGPRVEQFTGCYKTDHQLRTV